jgi:hypothetical protein
VRRRPGQVDQFAVAGVTERVAPYEHVHTPSVEAPDADADLVERAVMLLQVMPPNQHREAIEELLFPGDPGRGRHAVDALIEGAFAVEDGLGRLHRVINSASG